MTMKPRELALRAAELMREAIYDVLNEQGE